MNKMIRRISALLAFVILLSSVLIACDKDKDDEKDPNAWSLGEEGRSAEPDEIPEDTDLNGYEYTFLHRMGEWIQFYECTGNIEGENVNPVYRTVYERNLRVENRLNCDIKWIATNTGDYNEVINHLKADDYYDSILVTNHWIVTRQVNTYLVDFNDAEYVDYSKPWWWMDIMNEIAFDGRTINYLVGDMNILNISKMSAFYFNFDLIKERLQMQPQDFYNMVNEGRWTISAVDELSAKCYRDLNGNGDEDEGDLFAFPWTGGEVAGQFVLSTKVATEFYTRDASGLVTLNMVGNNDIYQTVTSIRKLLRENQGVRDYSNQPAGAFDGLILEEFASNEYVFLAQRLSAACSVQLREMQSSYGILPYPVLNEGDEYVSDINQSSTCMCAPKIAEKNLELIGIVLEALCSEAYRYTYDAFFLMALKGRYTNDIESAKMVDLIYNTAHKSFLTEFDGKANGIVGCLYGTAIAGETNVMTLLEQRSGAEQTLNNYIAETKATIQGYTG